MRCIPLVESSLWRSSLSGSPDDSALEQEILAWWEREGTFDKLRGQNRGAERSASWTGRSRRTTRWASITPGAAPIRILPALQGDAGLDQRYQNGFDCQGLWVEVEVEKALGFNSKRDIESYGLADSPALQGAV